MFDINKFIQRTLGRNCDDITDVEAKGIDKLKKRLRETMKRECPPAPKKNVLK